jgi:hypothetical protein
MPANRTEYAEAQMNAWKRTGHILQVTDARQIQPGDTILQWISGKNCYFAVPGIVTRVYRHCGYAKFEFDWAGGSNTAKFFIGDDPDAAWTFTGCPGLDERTHYFEVTHRHIVSGELTSGIYAIDEIDGDTEASIFNELLNVAERGGDWEWHANRKLTRDEYVNARYAQ